MRYETLPVVPVSSTSRDKGLSPIKTKIVLHTDFVQKGMPMRSVGEIWRIKKKVEKKLLAVPGVTGVNVGYKYVDGKITSVVAIRVMAREKKDVPQESSIPREIEGVPTDVIERRFVLQSSNRR